MVPMALKLLIYLGGPNLQHGLTLGSILGHGMPIASAGLRLVWIKFMEEQQSSCLPCNGSRQSGLLARL